MPLQTLHKSAAAAIAMGMIARSRLMKSALFSATASGCRWMSSSSSSSCLSSSIKNNNKNNDHLFLVSRYTRETNRHYFSLVSTENWTTVCDFHSPHFGCYESFSASGCEGLVLLHSVPNEERLWNPLTNEFKLLPPSYIPRPPKKTYYTIYTNATAFGFDSKSQDYKVLRFVNNYYGNEWRDSGDPQLQIELYSLRDDSWKEIFDDPTHPYFVSDHLHSWYYNYSANGCCYSVTNGRNFLSFDFATESFSYVSSPETRFVRDYGYRYSFNPVEFEGLLGVIVCVHSRDSAGVPRKSLGFDGELWVWNGESWTLKFEIHVPGMGLPGILGFSSDDRFLLFTGEGKTAQLLAYDLYTQQVKKLDIYDYSINCEMVGFPCFDAKVGFGIGTSRINTM